MTKMSIKIPELVKMEKVGKNEIIRIIEPASVAEVESIASDTITLRSRSGASIQIQCEAVAVNETEQWILTTAEKPSVDALISGKQALEWVQCEKRISLGSVAGAAGAEDAVVLCCAVDVDLHLDDGIGARYVVEEDLLATVRPNPVHIHVHRRSRLHAGDKSKEEQANETTNVHL